MLWKNVRMTGRKAAFDDRYMRKAAPLQEKHRGSKGIAPQVPVAQETEMPRPSHGLEALEDGCHPLVERLGPPGGHRRSDVEVKGGAQIPTSSGPRLPAPAVHGEKCGLR